MTNFMFAESAKRDVPLVWMTRLVSPPTIGLFGIKILKLPFSPKMVLEMWFYF